LPVAWDWVEDKLVVTDVEPAGRQTGIHPGDVVVSIGGKDAIRCFREAQELVSGATPQFRQYRALQDLRNGPAGEEVAVVLEPPGKASYTVKLKRQPADDTPLRGPSLRERRLPKVTELEPGLLYVDLDRTSVLEIKNLFPRLREAKGIVFDTRGYPAFSLDLLARMSDRPLKSDRWIIMVARFPDRQHMTTEESDWTLPPQKPRLNARIAFLTDGRAVSAAETLLSLVAEHKLAPIVGGPTAGSNGGVNVYVLPGGYRISWTGMKTLKLDGSRHHGVGILPTVAVHRTIKGLAAGRDEVLERAVELIRN
jgi:C-terminal processing protease CtpA/Prc